MKCLLTAVLTVVGFCLLTASTPAQTEKKPVAVFQPLGDLLKGERTWSRASDASADGSVVVGICGSAKGQEAFRWTIDGGMRGLGSLPGGRFMSAATAVSADGAVVVGSSSAARMHAFRWTAGTGMTRLKGMPQGEGSVATAVSANGSVVVGTFDGGKGGSGNLPFRWASGSGMKSLGYLPGITWAPVAVTGVSADGSVVVGMIVSKGLADIRDEAFRWSERTGMKGLGDLPGGAFYSEAAGVSADGNAIAGTSHSARGREAFYWTVTGGMKGLGDLNEDSCDSKALIISADGSVVIGLATTDEGKAFFIWDAANGMRNLTKILREEYRIDTGHWQRPWEPEAYFHITAMSADRRTLVGYGEGPRGTEAWRLTLPSPLGGKQDYSPSRVPRTAPMR